MQLLTTRAITDTRPKIASNLQRNGDRCGFIRSIVSWLFGSRLTQPGRGANNRLDIGHEIRHGSLDHIHLIPFGRPNQSLRMVLQSARALFPRRLGTVARQGGMPWPRQPRFTRQCFLSFQSLPLPASVTTSQQSTIGGPTWADSLPELATRDAGEGSDSYGNSRIQPFLTLSRRRREMRVPGSGKCWGSRQSDASVASVAAMHPREVHLGRRRWWAILDALRTSTAPLRGQGG